MRDEQQSKIYGMKAENYFAAMLNKFGIQYEFINDWFDFLINKKHKVEVKSCQLSVKDGKKTEVHYRPGRFDFTRKENRENQYKENVWVAFVLRHEGEFMLLGFVRARELEKKRYITLIDLRKFEVLTFDHWLIQVNQESK